MRALRFERKLFSDSSSITATPEIYRKTASTNAVCPSRIVVQHKNIQNNNAAFQGKGEPTQRVNPSSTYRSSGPGKAPWNGRGAGIDIISSNVGSQVTAYSIYYIDIGSLSIWTDKAVLHSSIAHTPGPFGALHQKGPGKGFVRGIQQLHGNYGVQRDIQPHQEQQGHVSAFGSRVSPTSTRIHSISIQYEDVCPYGFGERNTRGDFQAIGVRFRSSQGSVRSHALEENENSARFQVLVFY